jgi:phosphoglycerol transferase MdoB-like AlkP superfamily enzyme
MTRYDDRMKDALSTDDETFLRDLEDGRGLFTQLGATFTGPMGGWGIYAFIMAFVMFVLLLVSGWNAWQAETVEAVIVWSAVSVSLVIALGLVKLWLFMRMNQMALLRELKKIELRVARIEEAR